MVRKPIAIERGDAGLDDVRREVLGKHLNDVEYIVAAGDRWPAGHKADTVVHETDMGLVLRVDDSSLNVTWAMDGRAEGLAVTSGSAPEGFFGIAAEAIRVGDRKPWPSLLGSTVVDLNWAWHRPYEGLPDLLWAVRVDLDVSESVVMALGAVEGGFLRYLPDSLLVIFSKDVARSYSPPVSEGSAWG